MIQLSRFLFQCTIHRSHTLCLADILEHECVHPHCAHPVGVAEAYGWPAKGAPLCFHPSPVPCLSVLCVCSVSILSVFECLQPKNMSAKAPNLGLVVKLNKVCLAPTRVAVCCIFVLIVAVVYFLSAGCP